MTIETKLMRLIPGAAALTVWPFVFVVPGLYPHQRARIDRHEAVHLEQHRRWFVYGLGVGLLLWFALYLFALPVGWNPWRRKWETEAMRKEGRLIGDINAALRKAPYYLWW